MTRSSRHKSSKHSSRDGREYSDSEKDLSLKERKGKEYSSSKVSKGSLSGEKRKFESKDDKDVIGSANGVYSEEYSGSSKRRKERVANDVANDRWNGGGEDGRGEGSKKSKVLNDSNSKRKEENDGKHKDLSRKEGREGGGERERDRKGKESGRVTDNGREVAASKKETTESCLSIELRKHEPVENQLDKRSRRRDVSGDGDKHQDHIGSANAKRLSSQDDISKDKREKDEKLKNQRSKDKYHEDVAWDDKRQEDKQRDERPAKNYNSRSDDENLRDEKDTTEVRQKKLKPQYHDHDAGHDRDSSRYHDRDKDRERGRDRKHDRESRDLDRDLDRSRNHTRDKEWGRESGCDRNHEHSREHNRERDKDRHRDRESDRDRDRDFDDDGSHLDERNARYKDSRGKKRSADGLDDCNDSKSRGIKVQYSDTEKKSLGRVESDADRGRSQSGQVHLGNNNNRRTSPYSNSYVHMDDYRDSLIEERSKLVSSREVVGFSGVSERASKKRMDDGNMGEAERSSNSKASPRGLVERSPSSTGIDRRYMIRAGVRRSIDVEETGRRGSASLDARDFCGFEDRGRAEKHSVDDYSQADSSFHHRTSQSNSSLIPPTNFRPGIESPSFMGSIEEESRGNSMTRHKWNGDRSGGRGHGNAWRGIPNWPSPVPNGLIPYQHGPPHGGYQAMMPQYPAVPLLGVRPSMEINHSGFPYHIPDTEMFPGHLRPPGWQNMMGGSGTSHMHGWDGNNGLYRDEAHMYGVPAWEPNRHMMNGQGWDTRAEMWKGSNGDVNKDLYSASQRENYPVQYLLDNDLAGQAGEKSPHENNHPIMQAKSVATMRSDASPAKENSKAPPITTIEKTPNLSKKSTDDDPTHFSCYYLSRLDISEELTQPELYNQCMSLVNLEERATVELETTRVHLKDDARSGQKTSYAKLSQHLPAIQDSVFQIAMDLYTKQCTELRRMGIDCRKTVPVPIADTEMTDAPIPSVDQTGEDEAFTSAQEPLVKPISSLCKEEVQDKVPTLSPKNLEIQAQSLTQVKEDPLTISSEEKMDSTTSDLANLDADMEPFSNQDSRSNTATDLPTDGYNVNETCKTNTVVNGPLDDSDGEILICESNEYESESESVILSRIHHSTESTH